MSTPATSTPVTGAFASFADLCSNFLVSQLGTVVNYLNTNKGVQVTVQELVTLLQINTAVTQTATPTMAFGAPALPTVAPRARATASTTASSGSGCSYIFKRGQNKDKQCEKPCAPGSTLCNAHARNNKSGESAAQSAPGVYPGAPGYSAPSIVPEEKKLDVYSVPGHEEEIFYEPTSFFAFTVINGTPMVIGKYDKVSSNIVPLTAEEKSSAKNQGYTLCETTEAAAAAAPAAASLPTLPSIPSIPNLPSIPSFPSRT